MTDTTVPITARGGGYLGWRAERRPRPGFAHVLGAAAGGFAVVSMVAFVAAIDNDDPQVPGVVLSVVLIVAALAIGLLGSGPLRSAAVTMLVAAVPLLWVFAIATDDAGRNETRAVLLLTLFSYAALYLLGWTRGRAVLLGGSLVVLTIWVAFEVAGDGRDALSSTPFADAPVSAGGLAVGGSGGFDDSTRAAIMLLGIAFLIVGAIVDNRRLAGTATPFLLVGSISAIVGGVSLAASESTLAAGIVAVLIGSAIGIIGAAGVDRRGTTWLGVLTVFGGAVAILTDIAPDEAEGVGAIALGFAVVLGGLAWLLAPILGEPNDGNPDLTSPPTAPEGGTTGDPGLIAGEAAA